MFGKKKYNYKNPYAPKSEKKSLLKSAFGAYLGNKETPEEKKQRLETQYQLYTTEARTLKAKNALQRERNNLKKLSENMGVNSNTPDYLGLYSKSKPHKPKDPFEDLGNFKF